MSFVTFHLDLSDGVNKADVLKQHVIMLSSLFSVQFIPLSLSLSLSSHVVIELIFATPIYSNVLVQRKTEIFFAMKSHFCTRVSQRVRCISPKA